MNVRTLPWALFALCWGLFGCGDVTVIGDDRDTCGDGVLTVGEECDDGNREPGDGCDSGCTLEPVCGDGELNAAQDEECDDGNTDSGDGCDSDCVVEYCGDGTLQPALGEECDDGNVDDGDGCTTDCVVEYCGDGTLQPALGEECDDGNNDDGDGCDSQCGEEPAPPPGPCPPGSTSVLVNPGFESGDVVPWQEDVFCAGGAAGAVVSELCHEGSFCWRTDGNVGVRQVFASPVPVSSMVSATFWSRHDDTQWGMSTEWEYTDGTVGRKSFEWESVPNLWAEYDLLPEMDPSKTLRWIRTTGYVNGTPVPDVTHFDDYRFCATPGE